MAKFTASDGLRLSYISDDYTDPWRKSDTLVMVHAAMGSARRFYAWVPHLARDFRVVRLELRGHGESEIPGPTQLTFERLRQDVVELARPSRRRAGASHGFVGRRLRVAKRGGQLSAAHHDAGVFRRHAGHEERQNGLRAAGLRASGPRASRHFCAKPSRTASMSMRSSPASSTGSSMNRRARRLRCWRASCP